MGQLAPSVRPYIGASNSASSKYSQAKCIIAASASQLGILTQRLHLAQPRAKVPCNGWNCVLNRFFLHLLWWQKVWGHIAGQTLVDSFHREACLDMHLVWNSA